MTFFAFAFSKFSLLEKTLFKTPFQQGNPSGREALKGFFKNLIWRSRCLLEIGRREAPGACRSSARAQGRSSARAAMGWGVRPVSPGKAQHPSSWPSPAFSHGPQNSYLGVLLLLSKEQSLSVALDNPLLPKDTEHVTLRYLEQKGLFDR